MNNLYVNENSLTVGYNLMGQKFFDTLLPFKEFIHSYFFSITEGFIGKRIDINDTVKVLSQCNTYGFNGNILLNTYHPDNELIPIIETAMSIVTVNAVTVLAPAIATMIKNKYPELEIHLSVKYWDSVADMSIDNIMNLICPEIDIINISGAKSYNDVELIDACHKAGIKTKFIANEGCIVGRDANYNKLPSFESFNCDGSPCNRVCQYIRAIEPWLNLTNINLYKESLKYYNHDIIKLSTRSMNNPQLENILKYWTSPDRTNYWEHMSLNDNQYITFLEWIEARSKCSNDCISCMKCKTLYNKLMDDRFIKLKI